MRPFHFTAQTVLDLRKRQDESAQRALADAVRARRQADTTVETATAAVDKSIQQAHQALERPASSAAHAWHRTWITCQQQVLAARKHELVACQATEQDARQRAYEARRALRMLERWRARAWRRYQQATRRDEQRELDSVGTLQYAARRRAPGDEPWK